MLQAEKATLTLLELITGFVQARAWKWASAATARFCAPSAPLRVPSLAAASAGSSSLPKSWNHPRRACAAESVSGEPL